MCVAVGISVGMGVGGNARGNGDFAVLWVLEVLTLLGLRWEGLGGEIRYGDGLAVTSFGLDLFRLTAAVEALGGFFGEFFTQICNQLF